LIGQFGFFQKSSNWPHANYKIASLSKKKKKNYKIATDRLTNMIHELAKAEEIAEFENYWREYHENI